MRLAVILLLLLAACAETPPEPAPSAAAAAPRSDPPRRAARPTRPAAATPAPAGAPAGPMVWRVTRETTTACADAVTLRRLQQDLRPGAVPARDIAAARAEGGCVTVFRDSAWRLLGQEGELLRLAPAEDAAPPLYFWRSAVEPDRAA